MCLAHNTFSRLMRSISFTKHLLAIVIDDTHCVFQWGNNDGYRKHSGELGRLRSFVPTSVPFLATSATLPPHVLSDITYRLDFSVYDTLLVDLGNLRPNVTTVLVKMAAARDLNVLNFVVYEALTGGSLVRSLVFSTHPKWLRGDLCFSRCFSLKIDDTKSTSCTPIARHEQDAKF